MDKPAAAPDINLEACEQPGTPLYFNDCFPKTLVPQHVFFMMLIDRAGFSRVSLRDGPSCWGGDKMGRGVVARALCDKTERGVLPASVFSVRSATAD